MNAPVGRPDAGALGSTARGGQPAECRLLVHGPSDGAWNMAVDEVILATAAESGLATLRFYQWERATLSLGYFQPFAERTTHAESQAADLVRRTSGGGAIVHDQELTYSLALPVSHVLARDTSWLYDEVHWALIAVLARHGVIAKLAAGNFADEANAAAAASEPFLCFQRRSPNDVLVAAEKICGSAQRRRRGARVQHGSVLLNRSVHAPQLVGLLELTPIELSIGQLTEEWTAELAGRLSLRFVPAELTAEERAEVDQLVRDKYRSDTWNQRR